MKITEKGKKMIFPEDDIREELNKEQHSDGAIAGVSIVMIVVAIAGMAIAF